MRRLVHTASNWTGPDLTYMLHLTYPEEYPADGRIVKRHWANLRRRLESVGPAGLWVLEFQRRGAPHIHALSSRLPGRLVNRKTGERIDFRSWLSNTWARIVDARNEDGEPDLKHLVAGTRVELLREKHAAAAYAAKYASKWEQKEVPEGFQNVGRFWGTYGGGGARLERLIVATVELPAGAVANVPDLETLAGGRVDPDRLVLVDPGAAHAAVRVARTLARKQRAAAGLSAPRRDSGECGFRTFGTAPAMRSYLGRGLLA
jgi:hypothetical protein